MQSTVEHELTHEFDIKHENLNARYIKGNLDGRDDIGTIYEMWIYGRDIDSRRDAYDPFKVNYDAYNSIINGIYRQYYMHKQSR